MLLNCDIGESYGAWHMGLDEEVMPLIDCANIACGYHAGDPVTMGRTVALAARHGVRIGAHPAYPDLVGFGRRSMACSGEEIESLLHYQIGALQAFCALHGTRVEYVKPHGALYNDMMVNPTLLASVLKAVAAYKVPLVLLATADNSAQQALASEQGVTLWFESFADRAYEGTGQLVSRRLPGAVHEQADTIVAQALALARGEPLTARDGSTLQLHTDTLCVHGDNPASVAAVRRIREALRAQRA
ncbi:MULTISPECIES: 5-oxoprolinase subunit PxpA [Pseudomonas]|uniref:LamB/YcsF family protein n=1 Tax=Pseudomonas quercus TaxID=2722792 RepID=A0ABX0YCC2_9PSED|nr:MULTISPECIES: 5-oxoprolinase subunit PxpA [Pseudomonas]MBF7142495.1 LamB/YcsF family protein [Pseudomonas sp. LY10J]NJP01033.1 LamB/YcsF family protein [Pseudomonas quercus]